MVKLASARENRMYGPRGLRNRWEYISAGIYVIGTIILVGGFAAQFSYSDAKSGLVVVLIGTAVLIVVNAHDLIAHMAGIDYCFWLLEHDSQLGLVELAVPTAQILGSLLEFVAILFLLLQMVKGYSYRLEKYAVGMLIAGPALWVLGSIHNLCQIYERADGHVQILQKTVQIPFLMGSLMFFLGGIFNHIFIFGSVHHDFKIMGRTWVWLSISGSLFLFVGGFLNVVKVFKMQQMDGVRLEKLRGGALERLGREREGKVPLILEDNMRRRSRSLEEEGRQATATPYKDVLVGGGSQA